jgi:phage repressor protein C with HTH and peptisase S24 domain
MQAIFYRLVFYYLVITRFNNGMKVDTKITALRRGNLRKWIELECGGAQTKFIDKTGINQGELSGLLREKSFGEKKARSIEELAGMPAKWLDEEHVEMPPDSFKVDPKKLSYPPVFGKAMGGLPDNLFTDEGREVQGHDEYGEVYSSDVNAFITRVEGNSMFPKYHHHGYALVEPNTPSEIEDDVLIKINTGQVMLKRLVSRRGGVVLSSYNDKEIHSFTDEEITWMYYVAYPVPARKIKHRL